MAEEDVDVGTGEEQAGGAEGEAAAGDKGSETYWPDDWRTQLAGDDAKALKRLERMASPSDVYKSWGEMEREFHSRKATPVMPGEDADEKDVAAYRKSVGIPDEAAGYFDKLSEGRVIADQDKPIVEEFLKAMHQRHTPPETVASAVDWYFGQLEENQAALAEIDKKDEQAAEDALRKEWGGEYRGNRNALDNYLAAGPEDMNLLEARLADGSKFKNSPTAMQWLMGIVNEANPPATIVPGHGDPKQAIAEEITKIETTMREDRTAYNRDEAMQERYRNLLAARERMSAKAA